MNDKIKILILIILQLVLIAAGVYWVFSGKAVLLGVFMIAVNSFLLGINITTLFRI